MDFRRVNVALDIFCMIVCVLLMIYLMRSADRKERLNRLFVGICLCNLGMLLGDLPNWLCEGHGRWWFPAALWAGCLLQYLSGVWLLLAYSRYLEAYLSSGKPFLLRCLRAVNILVAAATGFVLLNLGNGMFYYIDGANVYHRGEWWWLSQTIPVVIMLIDMAIVLSCRSQLTRKSLSTFLAYLCMPLPAILLQGAFYGLACTYPVTTLAILVIFLNIQADQQLLMEQKKKELAENRMDIMLSQIQPHFLYNALTAIAQLCRKNPEKAEEATVVFARYLRANMDSLTQKKPVPFETELRQIENYLFLEKIRFGEELKIVYDIRATNFSLPILTVQPVVENAVKHGVGKKEDGGLVALSVREEEREYVITVSDDGVGFEAGRDGQGGRAHIGLENVTWRLRELVGGTLEVRSRVGEGTAVTIKIPKGEERRADFIAG